MDSHELSLTHLVRQPLQSVEPGEHTPLLLMLHGVGSNERDLFSLAPHLDGRFLIISARAPNVQGPGSYAWFRVQFTPQGPVIDPDQEEASRQKLISFIGEATASYGVDPAQVYLMGFSQGAIMSASLALTRPDLVAGAVLMSGRILPEIFPLVTTAERLTGLPLLVVHGTDDAVLPIHHGRASRELLEKLPVRLEYREYDIGHAVSSASLQDVTQWLSERLDEHVKSSRP